MAKRRNTGQNLKNQLIAKNTCGKVVRQWAIRTEDSRTSKVDFSRLSSDFFVWSAFQLSDFSFLIFSRPSPFKLLFTAFTNSLA